MTIYGCNIQKKICVWLNGSRMSWKIKLKPKQAFIEDCCIITSEYSSINEILKKIVTTNTEKAWSVEVEEEIGFNSPSQKVTIKNLGTI